MSSIENASKYATHCWSHRRVRGKPAGDASIWAPLDTRAHETAKQFFFSSPSPKLFLGFFHARSALKAIYYVWRWKGKRVEVLWIWIWNLSRNRIFIIFQKLLIPIPIPTKINFLTVLESIPKSDIYDSDSSKKRNHNTSKRECVGEAIPLIEGQFIQTTEAAAALIN